MGISLIYYLIAVAIFLLLYKTRKKISISLLITYCFLVFATTVLARTSQSTASYDLTPFKLLQTKEWWTKHDHMLQIKANILMFVPIGFLMIQAGFKIKGKITRVLFVILTVLTGFLFSVLIEYMQYKLHRGYCETDDVIHNTIGTVAGVVLYVIINRIVTELEERNVIHHTNF